MAYLRYHRASGSIQSRLTLDPMLAVESDPDFQLLEAEGTQAGHWINQGEVAPRTPYDAHTAVPLVECSATAQPVVTDLPGPCWVRISGRGSISFEQQLVHVSGDTLMFVPEIAGIYVVMLDGEYVGPEVRFEVIELDVLKQRRIDEITALKANAAAAGVMWNGYRWDAGPTSQLNLTGMASSINAGLLLPEGFYWTDYDNENVSIDAAGILALGNAMVAFTFAIHRHSRSLKVAVADAATLSEVEAIDLNAEWPISKAPSVSHEENAI